MNALIVYDSYYGNTEKIAQAIGKELLAPFQKVSKMNVSDLKDIDVLIVGSPVHGGRATPALSEFLKMIPEDSLKNKKVAAFDTRFAKEDHGLGLKIVMKIIRFAAERIARDLTRKGGILIAKPMGFIVEDKKGPLKKGELELAKKWAGEVKKNG